MQVLVDAREKLEIPWEHPNTEYAALETKELQSNSCIEPEQFNKVSPIIHSLWQDKAIKRAYERRREFQIVRILKNSTFFFKEFFSFYFYFFKLLLFF